VALGLAMLADGIVNGQVTVLHGQVRTGFQPLSVILGLVAFPLVLLVWQWIRARYEPRRLEALGPTSTAINMVILFALLLTPLYAPRIAFSSGAALMFYGASMLLAAVRGYRGCEVLAFSNWLLRRDDQVGCIVLGPVDGVESGLSRTRRQTPR
jgi:hypothetical protein